jgi:hypothetical protein
MDWSIADYSATPDSNTQINGINIDEGCPPSGINNALRQLMADIKTGALNKAGDTMTGNLTLGVKSATVNPTIVAPNGTMALNYIDLYPTKTLTAGSGTTQAAILRLRGEQNGVLSNTATYIQANCDLSSQAKLDPKGTTATDSSLLIRSGGVLFAGSGESATSLRSVLCDPAQTIPAGLAITGQLNDDSESAVFSADSMMFFVTNTQTPANARALYLDTNGCLMPADATMTQDLGRASYKWRTLYANTVTGLAAPSAAADAANKSYVDGTYSKAANGYVKLPNGVIFQWGYANLGSASSSVSVTFPLAFPAACRSVQITDNLEIATSARFAASQNVTATTFTIVGSDTSVGGVYWFAVGY